MLAFPDSLRGFATIHTFSRLRASLPEDIQVHLPFTKSFLLYPPFPLFVMKWACVHLLISRKWFVPFLAMSKWKRSAVAKSQCRGLHSSTLRSHVGRTELTVMGSSIQITCKSIKKYSSRKLTPCWTLKMNPRQRYSRKMLTINCWKPAHIPPRNSFRDAGRYSISFRRKNATIVGFGRGTGNRTISVTFWKFLLQLLGTLSLSTQSRRWSSLRHC